MTDENPWLLARVFDEGGINASGVGIGHDIKALDGQSDESIVLNNHYTTDLNTYKSGTVRYPFEGLEPACTPSSWWFGMCKITRVARK